MLEYVPLWSRLVPIATEREWDRGGGASVDIPVQN